MSRIEGVDSGVGRVLDSETVAVTGLFRKIVERFDNPCTLKNAEFLTMLDCFSIFDKCVTGVGIVEVLYSNFCLLYLEINLVMASGREFKSK